MNPPSLDQTYTLCTLVNKEDAETQFSPYVWATIIDLRYLLVNFTQKPYTFDGIRTALLEETGGKEVLVPLLRDTEGEWMTDSFEIGLYGRSLFLHGIGGREFCRFVHLWADTVLYPHLGAVVKARIWASLPAGSASSTYFANARFGGAEAATAVLALSQSPAASEHFAAARKELRLINTMLVHQRGQGKKFLGGEFSHADAAVFGWYMWSIQFAPEMRSEVWETAENEEVKAWVGEMRALPGWADGDFAQIVAELE